MRINLLPHRQIKRAEKQREFMIMLAGTAFAAAAVAFLGSTIISSKIETQTVRNDLLNAQIVKLDGQISEIKELKNKIQEVLARKQVIENLQLNRGQAATLLDELSRQLPEGVYLTSIKQQGLLVSISGVADSSARVASLVRNLSSSAHMGSPALIEIKAVMMNNVKQNEFLLNVTLKQVEAEEPATSDKTTAISAPQAGEPVH